MSAPISKVDVCNLAMDHIAGGIIVNIDNPKSEQEIKCARWYDQVRRALLRVHPFVFARARFQASRDSTTPVFGYADAYNLANDHLRLNFIGDDSVLDFKRRYAFEGRQLLLDNSGADSINLGYTKDEESVTKFDPLFIDLMAIELALKLSFAFTLKPSLKRDLRDERTMIWVEARAVNSQERPPVRVERSKFKSARLSLTSNVAGKNTVFRS